MNKQAGRDAYAAAGRSRFVGYLTDCPSDCAIKVFLPREPEPVAAQFSRPVDPQRKAWMAGWNEAQAEAEAKRKRDEEAPE